MSEKSTASRSEKRPRRSTHVYAHTHAQPDGQPENIIPPPPVGWAARAQNGKWNMNINFSLSILSEKLKQMFPFHFPLFIILIYRIIFGLVDLCMSDYFQPMSSDGDRTVTRGNPFK